MFSFFKGAIIAFAVIIGLIILFFVNKRIQRSRADRAAEEQKRRKQEAVQAMIDQQNREAAERDRLAALSRQKHEEEIEEAINQSPSSRQYRLETIQREVSVPELNITTFTPISKKKYVAFDLETTGLSSVNDAIIEIGAVRVENGVITDEYHQLINPERPVPPDAFAVNHISDDMLANMPKIHQVLPSFLSFVGDDTLAAHNAKFDIKFICQACMRNRFRVPLSCFDTMILARYWPESESKKLTALCSAAGIQVNQAHRALDDARLVSQLISLTNDRRNKKSHH